MDGARSIFSLICNTPALVVVGEEEAEVAEVLAGGSGDDGVAEGGEHGAGVEVGEGGFQMEAEGVGAGDGGGVGYGSGGVGVAVDAIGAGAEDGEALAGVLLEVQRAGHDKLLIASSCAGSMVHGDRNLANGDEAEAGMDGAQGVKALEEIA